MHTVLKSAGELPASSPGTNGPAKPLALRDGSITIAQLIDAYMAEYTGRDTTRPQRLRLWAARLGHLTLAELDDDHVFEAMDAFSRRHGSYYAGRDADGDPILKAKRRPLSPATLNRIQAALSAVLTWAQRRRITPKGWSNPCRAVALRPEKNERVRFLSADERERLLAACKASKWPMLYLLVLAAITTGARKSELLGLRWADIDLDRAEAAISRTKNSDAKVLALVPAVVDELRRFEGAPGALVFASRKRPDTPFHFDSAWDIALRAARVKDFRFHDCRHTCASYLAQAGAPLLQIADVLGHRQLSMTKRYSHLTTSHRAELVTRVMGDIR